MATNSKQRSPSLGPAGAQSVRVSHDTNAGMRKFTLEAAPGKETLGEIARETASVTSNLPQILRNTQSP